MSEIERKSLNFLLQAREEMSRERLRYLEAMVIANEAN